LGNWIPANGSAEPAIVSPIGVDAGIAGSAVAIAEGVIAPCESGNASPAPKPLVADAFGVDPGIGVDDAIGVEAGTPIGVVAPIGVEEAIGVDDADPASLKSDCPPPSLAWGVVIASAGPPVNNLGSEAAAGVLGSCDESEKLNEGPKSSLGLALGSTIASGNPSSIDMSPKSPSTIKLATSAGNGSGWAVSET
jgi:hypothetical protein